MSEVTVRAVFVDLRAYVTCVCGDPTSHEIELFPDEFGRWEIRIEDSYILCDECGALIDARSFLSIEVGP